MCQNISNWVIGDAAAAVAIKIREMNFLICSSHLAGAETHFRQRCRRRPRFFSPFSIHFLTGIFWRIEWVIIQHGEPKYCGKRGGVFQDSRMAGLGFFLPNWMQLWKERMRILDFWGPIWQLLRSCVKSFFSGWPGPLNYSRRWAGLGDGWWQIRRPDLIFCKRQQPVKIAIKMIIYYFNAWRTMPSREVGLCANLHLNQLARLAGRWRTILIKTSFGVGFLLEDVIPLTVDINLFFSIYFQQRSADQSRPIPNRDESQFSCNPKCTKDVCFLQWRVWLGSCFDWQRSLTLAFAKVEVANKTV